MLLCIVSLLTVLGKASCAVHWMLSSCFYLQWKLLAQSSFAVRFVLIVLITSISAGDLLLGLRYAAHQLLLRHTSGSAAGNAPRTAQRDGAPDCPLQRAAGSGQQGLQGSAGSVSFRDPPPCISSCCETFASYLHWQLCIRL